MKASFDYDATYEPAMPVVSIGISASGSNVPALSVTALIDSGADATMMPIDLLKEAGGRFVQQRQLRPVLGKHVAIFEGQLIDYDDDYAALYHRIDAQYPDQFVWLATVEEEPLPALVFCSPRFVSPE